MSAMRISRKTFHQKQDDFFNVLRTSTREDATKDDYQAVVTHSHYLFPIKSIKSSYSKECLLDYTFANRQSFYNRVLGRAKAKDRPSTDPVVEIKQLNHAFERLREAVNRARTDWSFQGQTTIGPGSEDLSDAQTYTVLSQRLALDIDGSKYILSSATPVKLAEIMQDQIANYIRVCIYVGEVFESMRGVASFESILSEAAYRVMNDGHGFSLPVALEKALSGFCINQGAHGKLSVAAWFTWARDRAIRRKDKGNEPLFEKASKGATMHFNHFITLYEDKVLARKYLVRFMARGAVALCVNCESGFDVVYPYLYEDMELDMQKVGFIIVQVKNDSNIGQSDFTKLFNKMDPFKYNLLEESDKEDGRWPIPIICSLSSQGMPTVEHMKYKSSSDGAMTLDTNGS
ncbi:hypothetical protein B0F90DRAFT_1840388 [Multifurca ochricompacta]|uniref:Uncharacterized protein n=1 Tax=Multifurca ochricompacta TaxID=376703 RepID=A0AAD4QLB8_9AGAM|nr:hypothetical protein B0F90DRAFT_1840388 [Multifurca ochricompacta]